MSDNALAYGFGDQRYTLPAKPPALPRINTDWPPVYLGQWDYRDGSIVWRATTNTMLGDDCQ